MKATPPPAPKPMSAIEWAQLLLLGVLWGGSFFFARIAVAEIEPLTLVFYRVTIGAIALHVWLVARGASFRPALPRAGSFLVLALLNNVIPFSLLFSGQTVIGAGLAAVLNATTPFWTILAANMLTSDEKITPNRMAGILLGVLGTAVMVGPAALTGLGAPLWAQLCVIGASISYGLANIFARRFRSMPPDVVAAGQMTASAAIMALAIGLGASGIAAASLETWGSVAALGLLSTALAYILFFSLIGSAGATNASLVTLVVPVSAILLGVLFLGEGLNASELAGMVLIGLGLVTIDGRIFRSRAGRKTESAGER